MKLDDLSVGDGRYLKDVPHRLVEDEEHVPKPMSREELRGYLRDNGLLDGL